ncbi:MAG TPA: hypothetical protein VL460_11900 [Caulobacteraceae bacterium]|jgi:hypothetical protein|nr:hypothetical protein [Caulobacteraceae bacterium]
MTRTVLHLAPFLLAAVLAACGPAPGAPAAAGDGPVQADTGYVAPPELVGAARQAGRLVLSGRAPAGAEVLLASPDGSSAGAKADGRGMWSLSVPAPAAAPAMYALSARIGERVVRAEGAVLALPLPGPPALLARAGVAALPLEGPSRGLSLTALDYDEGGGAAVAGVSPAGARVRLSIDGIQAGLDQADARGRFAVLGASRPLEPGQRRLRVEMDGAAPAQAAVMVSRAAPLGRAAFRAERQAGGWRVDWARAGGGVQTTLVFDVAGAGS